MKKVLLGFIIGISLIVFLAAGILVWLTTDHAKQLARQTINRSLPGKVEWGEIQLAVLGSPIVIKDLRLQNVNGQDIGGFSEFRLKWSWFGLIGGNLIISGVLENPWVDLTHDLEGHLNFQAALIASEPQKKDDSTSFPLNIVVDKLILSNGSLKYYRETEGFSTKIQRFNLTVSGNLATQTATVALTVADIELKSPRFKVKFDTVDLSAEYRNDRIDNIVLKTASTESNLFVKGTIEEPLISPQLSLRTELTSSLSEVQRMFNLKRPMDGAIAAHLNVVGKLANPDVDMVLKYNGGNLLSRRVDAIDLKMHMSDRIVHFDQARLTAGTGDVYLNGDVNLQKVFHKGLLTADPDMEAITYQLALKQSRLGLKTIFGDTADLTGNIDSRFSIAGSGISLKNLQARGSLELAGHQVTTNLEIAPVDVHLRSEASIASGQVNIQTLSVGAGDLSGEANGRFDLNVRTIDADLTMDAPNLSRALSPLGITDVRGKAGIKAHISGYLGKPQFSFKLAGSDLELLDLRLGDVDIDAALNPSGLLQIAGLSLKNQGSHIEAKGDVQVFKAGYNLQPDLPLNLDLTLSNIEAKDFVDKDLARGMLDAQVKLTGTTRSPRGHMDLIGRGIGIGAIPIGDINAALQFSNGNLAMEKVRVSYGGAHAQIDGTLGLFAPGTFKVLSDPSMDITLSGTNITLENYLKGYKGQFSLDTRLKGRLRSPRGPIKVHGKNFESKWQRFDQVTIDATFVDDKLRVDRLAVSPFDGEWVIASGLISTKEFVDVKVTSKGVALNRIDILNGKAPLDGRLSGQISAKGAFTNPTLSAQLTLSNVRTGELPLSDIHADLHLEERIAHVQMEHDAIALTGSYYFKTRGFDGRLRVNTDDMGPYLALAGLNDFSGQLWADIQAEGDLDDLAHIKASGYLENVILKRKGLEILRTGNTRLTYLEGKLEIPEWNIRLLEQGNVRVAATWRTDGDIELKAEGIVPLAIVRDVHPQLADLSGDLAVSLLVSGNQAKPQTKGNIDIRQAALTLPFSDQQLHGVTGTIRLEPNKLFIVGITGNLEEGGFNLDGEIDLAGYRPTRAQMSLAATNLQLSVPDTLDIFLDSKLELKGTPDDAALSGDITIMGGSYYKDISLNPLHMVKEKARPAAPKTREFNLPFLKNLNLNIGITARQPYAVDNNMAELQVEPNMYIAGTLNRPRITGRTDVREGTIKFRTRKFQIVKGILEYIDPYDITPVLDLRSEAEIRSWRVFMDISGKLDNLGFTFSSEPSEEPGDIISLILTGRTTDELVASEGGQNQSTAQVLALIANSAYGKEIQDIAGLDILEAEKVADAEADADQTRITIGKNLSRRMTIKYGLETKDGELVEQSIAEYKIYENLLLAGFQDNKGAYGGALRFRIEFR